MFVLKGGTMSNLINNYCLTCTKPKCRGNCTDFKNYIKHLKKNKLIKNKGGRPKKLIESVS